MTMTMKPKYFLALGLLALGLGSCGESFFEQYPSNNITEGNFYKTDDDFNQGVRTATTSTTSPRRPATAS